jgi:hypothetical protein
MKNNGRYIPQKDDIFNAIIRVGSMRMDGSIVTVANEVARGCPCVCSENTNNRIVAKEKSNSETIRIFRFDSFTFVKIIKENNRGIPNESSQKN